MTVFLQGTLIWQRFTNVSCLRTYHGKKRQDSFDPQRVNLLGEDSICMVNLLVIPQKIVVFFLLHDWIASVVLEQKFCFVKRACKTKCRHSRYTLRSTHVKL